MDLFIIVFNQFEQLQTLMKSEFGMYVNNESELSKTIEINDFYVELKKVNQHFIIISVIHLAISHPSLLGNSYCFDGEELLLTMESTSGALGLEFFENNEKVREWREVEGQVVSNIGTALQYEPAGFFTDEPDDAGKRDEWSLIAIAEKYTGVLFNDWDIELLV